MIYLARHGQTEFNAVRRLQGQCDSPLTALGQDQARAMGLTLAGLIDPTEAVIVSSPLGRTRQTARIIAEAAGIGADVVFDPDLMEIGMGCWDGLTELEIDAEWPGARDGLDRFEWFFHSPDGETYGAFAARLARALARVEAYPATTRIIVSHGVAGRVIRGLFEGLDETKARRLDAPQDAIFRLANGKVERIPTGLG